RLRGRDADGTDEQPPLRRRDDLHSHEPGGVVHGFQAGARGLALWWRCLGLRARADREGVGGEVQGGRGQAVSDRFLDVDEEQPVEEVGIESILNQLLDLIAAAKSMPLSSSVM